ncbi:hypothetical protein [Fibrobacter sp. UWB12]|uniref:hypothetical protein n=1 Tax=Fibrobacter sp. UWB12 TaxID=1896203 RepID=UPI00091F2156|nr:hypothetical protein [Fibrobacter sp. UWB12]SHK20505.1 ppGpp synthetase catalytic domain-containing protein (RelA/SpoT-type nucleotidyltranferase) [Fibrobacter sp. UWB12]
MPDHNIKLCEALESMSKSELIPVRQEINTLLTQLIDEQKLLRNTGEKKSDEPSFLFDSIASRIKSVESFKEKIPRNNYIVKWKINDDFTENDYKNVIRDNLDDLIGFRINCFFKSKENTAYDSVIEFLEKNSIVIKDNGKNLETGEIKKQKNGHIIYKIVCKINAKNGLTYKFELQIKSLIHTLWGEVDHEIAYKAPLYDYDYETKNNLLNNVFKTLESSDAQLKKIADFTYTENDLTECLFFLNTKKHVEKMLNGKNPVASYRKFFSTFKSQNNEIKRFVANNLLGNGSPAQTPYNPSLFPQDYSNLFLKTILNDVLEKALFADIIPIVKIIFSFPDDERIYESIAQQIELSILQEIKKQDPLKRKILDPEDGDENVGLDDPGDKKKETQNQSYQPHIYRDDQETLNKVIEINKKFSSEQKDILIKCLERMYKIFIGD